MKTNPHVIIYTKPGCHLCDEAKAQIAAAACDNLYTLEEINIEDDPALSKRYGWDIPVVLVNGTVAFKHRLTAADFRDALAKYR